MRRKRQYFEWSPGEPAPLSCTVTRRLCFSEVDAMAVAWHGRYLEFFEAAHTELMHKAGLDYKVYRAEGLAAPMVQSHVDYFQPLRLDEIFAVEAKLFWSDGARLDVAYRIEKENGVLAASGFTVQMFVRWPDGEPFVTEPDLIVRFKERWRKGEIQ